MDLILNGVKELVDLKDKLSKEELMEKVDSSIVYEGSSKLSEKECEILDTMDELFVEQFKMKRQIVTLTEERNRQTSRKDKMLEVAKQVCTNETYLRLLQASGYQLPKESLDIIENSMSDKEQIEMLRNSEKEKVM